MVLEGLRGQFLRGLRGLRGGRGGDLAVNLEVKGELVDARVPGWFTGQSVSL